MKLPPLSPGMKFTGAVLGPGATRSAKYSLLKSGKFPVLTVGKLIYVPTAQGLRALDLDPKDFMDSTTVEEAAS
jgi:hypothetical protein